MLLLDFPPHHNAWFHFFSCSSQRHCSLPFLLSFSVPLTRSAGKPYLFCPQRYSDIQNLIIPYIQHCHNHGQHCHNPGSSHHYLSPRLLQIFLNYSTFLHPAVIFLMNYPLWSLTSSPTSLSHVHSAWDSLASPAPVSGTLDLLFPLSEMLSLPHPHSTSWLIFSPPSSLYSHMTFSMTDFSKMKTISWHSLSSILYNFCP